LHRGAREKAEESLRKIEAFTAEMQRTPRKKERSFASLRMTTLVALQNLLLGA
jgi:hypothetical protein